jgi:CRP/FNR family transcriptional regulator, nitrogen fixation regulation protein
MSAQVPPRIAVQPVKQVQNPIVQAANGSSLSASFGLMGATLNFGRNVEVFGEAEEAEYLYQVKAGCVRAYRVLNDGRRQVCTFYLPGDIFGFEAGNEHSFSAEAIVASTITVVKRSLIESRASGDSTLARQLFDLSVGELRRAQGHVLLLIKSAQERVAGFLLEMASRKQTLVEIELPMSRQDIADYLGLTIETVSRTLTQLADTATIALPSSRRILLRNRAALARLNA